MENCLDDSTLRLIKALMLRMYMKSSKIILQAEC